LLNMFRATMCPSSGADDCVVLSPRVGIGIGIGIEEFIAQWSCATNSSMNTLPANWF